MLANITTRLAKLAAIVENESPGEQATQFSNSSLRHRDGVGCVLNNSDSEWIAVTR